MFATKLESADQIEGSAQLKLCLSPATDNKVSPELQAIMTIEIWGNDSCDAAEEYVMLPALLMLAFVG